MYLRSGWWCFEKRWEMRNEADFVCSFRIRSGMLGGAMKCLIIWRNRSRKSIRRGRSGIGVRCL